MVGQFPCTSANSMPIRAVTREVRYIHELSLTLEYSVPISSPAAPGLTSPRALHSRVLQASSTWQGVFEYLKQSEYPSGCFQAFLEEDTPPEATQVTHKHVYDGPITCSRAKLLQKEVTSFLAETNLNIHENIILPKNSSLILLRCSHEERDQIRQPVRTTSSDHKKKHQSSSDHQKKHQSSSDHQNKHP